MVTIRFFLIVLAALWTFYSVPLEAKAETNSLNKAFYYVGRAEMPGIIGKNIDLGRFVLLFDQKPIVNILPHDQRVDQPEKLVVFFPYACVGKDCKKMVEAFNAAKSKYYTFKLEQLEKPIAGLQLSIAYDPKKVGWDQRRLETIKYDKGIEIRLHDRELLERIQKAPAPRVATLVKKKQSLLIVGMEEQTQELFATV